MKAPLPTFSQDTAVRKVRFAEEGWKSRDPEAVSLARGSSTDKGAEGVPRRKDRCRYAYEWRDSGNWFRGCGNENWEFGEDSLTRRRLSCINDLPIAVSDRKIPLARWQAPDGHPCLNNLGL